MMLGNIKLVSADTKINSIIKNKNQDVLFVGTISHISDDYFVIIARLYQYRINGRSNRKKDRKS